MKHFAYSHALAGLLITFVSTLFTTSTAWADNVQVVDPPTETIYRDSSAFNRMNKNYSLTYMAFGIGPSRSGSIGLTLGVFLSRNSQIDFEVVSGRPLWTNWYTWSEYDIKTSSAGIHYKHFLGNSFYFRVGADYRKVNYRHTSRDIFTNEIQTENRFEGDSITGTILIGNQWQWENFTLGCDWFGYALPVTSSVHSESVTGPYANNRYLEEDKDWLLKKAIGVGLRFYLGASF